MSDSTDPAPAEPDPVEVPDPVTLRTEFAGRRGALFWLALKTSVLTVLTLGLYRFWMKTRLRRYYWSSIRPGGVPLEYVGEPLEKLLGFLIAVVFLAFYIGIVNLILMFFSFAWLGGSFAAYAVSFVGVIPILFFARYRARRYILARTRWRGIRFGLEPGAWGYAWRAMVHWALAILTLGLLWPRKTFWLEKYVTDRTYFGTVRLHQGGRWTMLFWPIVPFLIGTAVSGVAIYLASEQDDGPLIWLTGSLPLMLWGFVNYRVQALRRLTSHKTAGDIALTASPNRLRVLWIYVSGFLLVTLALFALLVAAIVGLILLIGSQPGQVDIYAFMNALQRLPRWLTTGLGVGLYFAFFILWGVLTNVFLTLPLVRHYARTFTITGAEHLDAVRQRDRDTFAEAEGFAEALDVGAAI